MWLFKKGMLFLVKGVVILDYVRKFLRNVLFVNTPFDGFWGGFFWLDGSEFFWQFYWQNWGALTLDVFY